MKLFKRLIQLKRIFSGFIYKWKIDLFGIGNLQPLVRTSSSPEIIVSITSYGRRVTSVVYYTIISVLKQKFRPNRIILWLDSPNWTIENIPVNLRKLNRLGVEIRFHHNIRSYGKLIPTLKENPNDIIITLDDDVLYSNKNHLQMLYEAYLKYPNKIICGAARHILFDVNNQLLPYNDWTLNSVDSKYILPLGSAGILYPPNSLDSEVFNENVFMKLCPIADDLWFFIMAIKKQTKHYLIEFNINSTCAFDDLYQYFHKGSALTHSNSKENMNDIQLKNILQYYNIKL